MQMKTRSFLLLAGASLVAASAFADTLVNAVPAVSLTSAAVGAQRAPYHWQGYFGPKQMVTNAYVPSCPLRKMWVETSGGPRLKWRRACPEQE